LFIFTIECMVYLEIVSALVGSNVDIRRSAVGVFKMYRFNMREDQLVWEWLRSVLYSVDIIFIA